MTPKEEELLRALTLAVDRLKRRVVIQQSQISQLEGDKARLEDVCNNLQEELKTAQRKNELLMASRVLVADEGDWLKARKRLEDLRNDLLRAIKLLDAE